MNIIMSMIMSIFIIIFLYQNDLKLKIKDYIFIYISYTFILYIFDTFICRYILFYSEKMYFFKFVIVGLSLILLTIYLYLKLENKKIKNVIKKLDKTKIMYIFLNVVFFCGLDLIIRIISYNVNDFYFPLKSFANIHSLIVITSIIFILLYLPKTIRYIFSTLIYSFTIIIFIIQYMMINIKKEAFTIFDLGYFSEGMAFLNSLKDYINIELFLIVLFLIIVLGFIIYHLKKLDTYHLNLKVITKFVLFILFLNLLAFFSIEDYNPNNVIWNGITYDKYYYENYDEPIKSLEISGLYDYTFRDTYFYYINKINKIGSTEEINKLLYKDNLEKENNEYTGMFKDKNLVMIMLESIDNIVINDKDMKTLNKIRKEGYNFTNRYSALPSGGSTILTEFTTQTGILYNYRYKHYMYSNEYPESIPYIFGNLDYSTTYIHENYGSFYNRNTLVKDLGYKNSIFVRDDFDTYNEFDDTQLISNDEIYNKAFPKDKKFMTFITTIAAHGPYTDNGHCYEAGRYRSDLDCFGYRSSNTDKMLELLLKRLEEDNLLDDTIIVIYADHQSYFLDYPKNYLKSLKKIDNNYNIKSIPFIIYNPMLENKNFDMLVNDIDFVPTILNLFGIDYDPNYYLGRDLFSKDHENVIIFNDKSWYDGNKYSTNTKKTDNKNTQDVINKLNLNDMIITNNYYMTKK